MHSIVASRYARALADIAFDPKSQINPDVLAAEISSFNATISSSPELRMVLVSPAVPPTKKRAVTAKLAERLGLSRTAQNFLFVVIQHGRAAELKGIHESLLDAIDSRRGVVRADIFSAAELPAPEREVLEERLVSITGKKLRAIYSVDSKLLGGVLVKIGSQVYDGSVRGRLNAIGARLTATA
jgi:F-type H+-transporting ATPase subunit delta